jgi:hypothetical protein
VPRRDHGRTTHAHQLAQIEALQRRAGTTGLGARQRQQLLDQPSRALDAGG